jgi:hypothetical protein
VVDGQEVEQHGDAAEEAAVEQQVEALPGERAAADPRHEEQRQEAAGEAHGGDLGAAEPGAGGELRGEGHDAEAGGREDEQPEGTPLGGGRLGVGRRVGHGLLWRLEGDRTGAPRSGAGRT